MDMHAGAKPYARGEKNAIFAFWHGRMLLMAVLRPPGRKMHILTSTHRDGEVIAGIMHRFGFGTVRGSTTREGAPAAREALAALKAGGNLSVTPDGPRGPLMRVKPGLITLARRADVPVIPVAYASTRYRRIRSWDRFLLALPFATVYYAVGAPLFDTTTEILEAELARLTQNVDSKAGVA